MAYTLKSPLYVIKLYDYIIIEILINVKLYGILVNVLLFICILLTLLKYTRSINTNEAWALQINKLNNEWKYKLILWILWKDQYLMLYCFTNNYNNHHLFNILFLWYHISIMQTNDTVDVVRASGEQTPLMIGWETSIMTSTMA